MWVSVRRWGIRALLAIGALAAAALIIVSPYLLAYVARSHERWADIGNVGQAYGGISAILSGFALVAVAGSLVLQRQQVLIDRAYRDRERHFELLRLALEQPKLLAVLLPADPHSPEIVYANLWLGFWFNSWAHGGMSDQFVGVLARGIFRNTTVLEWWREAGPNWADGADAPQRRFVSLVTREWREVMAANAAMAAPDTTDAVPDGPPPKVEISEP